MFQAKLEIKNSGTSWCCNDKCQERKT